MEALLTRLGQRRLDPQERPIVPTAVSAALVLPALPAHADDPQRVRVAFVGLHAGPVDYDHPCVDVMGTLVSYPDSGAPSPVRYRASSRWVKRAVLVSNSHGAFAKTFKGARLGTRRVVFATAPGFWGSEAAR